MTAGLYSNTTNTIAQNLLKYPMRMNPNEINSNNSGIQNIPVYIIYKTS